MTRYKTVKVAWDVTDSESCGRVPPAQVDVPAGLSGHDVADWLSDTFGWCVSDWNWLQPEVSSWVSVKVPTEEDTEYTVLLVRHPTKEDMAGEDVAELLREQLEDQFCTVVVAWTTN